MDPRSQAQVEFAQSAPLRRAWVDTDDLNDGLNRRGKKIENDLHYSAEGYKELGRRFAREAIGLIRNSTLPVRFTEDFEKGHERWEVTDAKSWTHRKVDDNHVFGIHRRGSDYNRKCAARTTSRSSATYGWLISS